MSNQRLQVYQWDLVRYSSTLWKKKKRNFSETSVEKKNEEKVVRMTVVFCDESTRQWKETRSSFFFLSAYQATTRENELLFPRSGQLDASRQMNISVLFRDFALLTTHMDSDAKLYNWHRFPILNDRSLVDIVIEHWYFIDFHTWLCNLFGCTSALIEFSTISRVRGNALLLSEFFSGSLWDY